MGLFSKKDKKMTISEANELVYASLIEYTGWKFLKSQRCLRKTIDNIVFDICFYSSKYSHSQEYIGINLEFEMWNKKFDKLCNVNSKIGYVFFKPENDEWYDISTEKQLNLVIDDLKNKINEYVFPLIEYFENDYSSAIIYLSKEENINKYNIKRFNTFDKMSKDNK